MKKNRFDYEEFLRRSKALQERDKRTRSSAEIKNLVVKFKNSEYGELYKNHSIDAIVNLKSFQAFARHN